MSTPSFRKISLEAYKPGRSIIKKNIKVIKLSANESALGVSNRVKKVLKTINKNISKYPDGKFKDLRVKLKSFKGGYQPSINPNYLSDERDIHDLYATFDFMRKFSANNNISNIIKSPVNIDPLIATDHELLDHFKSNATTIYHPCGTCRMSKDIGTGVVSDKLKVHGLDNLWIVDASIMPNITSGNINAPVMMLSHLSSKIILEELKRQY